MGYSAASAHLHSVYLLHCLKSDLETILRTLKTMKDLPEDRVQEIQRHLEIAWVAALQLALDLSLAPECF